MAEEHDNAGLQEQLRFDALFQKISSTFGGKPSMAESRFKKSLGENEANQNILRKILKENLSEEHFFVIQTGSDTLQVLMELPANFSGKRKAGVFLKVFPDNLTPASISKLVYLEINKNILQTLHLLLGEVYLPILQNPSNQIGWTELISKDLMERLNNFVAQIYLVIGKIQGKTLLPLPLEKFIKSKEINDKDRAQIFESRIITWTKQIKKVIEMEPEQILKTDPNPGPQCELEFWRRKADNLNSIHHQIEQEDFQIILNFLRDNKSTFINQFESLQKDMKASRREANENNIYFMGLEDYFNKLKSYEFLKLPSLFPPIIHMTAIIYEKSSFYKSPMRIINFIREICNSIISRAKENISGDILASFLVSRDDIDQAVEKLQLTIDVFTKFKDTYYKYKSEKSWKFPVNALFVNFDTFLERCYDILHITTTIQQFNRLKSCKIGGTKGHLLTENIREIYEEFSVVLKLFQHTSYDLIDTSVRKFEDDFLEFRAKVKELERRLAAVIGSAFEDADTLIDRFKLLESFETMLKRPILQDELEKKLQSLLELYKADLKVVQKVFLESLPLIESGDPNSPIYNNLPPVSGALFFTRSLERRIIEPYERLLKLELDPTKLEEFQEVKDLKDSICKQLTEYKDTRCLRWRQDVEESSEKKLKQCLLVRKPDGTLEVNFDPSLVQLLREVKYFSQLNIPVPETALEIYKNDAVYRNQINKMEVIVGMQNKIITTLNEVERPLIVDKISRMDKALQQGIVDLKWKNSNVDEFIKNSQVIVEDVFKIVNKMKDDFNHIKATLTQFNQSMVERKFKSVTPEEFLSTHSASMSQNLSKIKMNGNLVMKSMKETLETIKADKKSKSWKDYQDYLNEFVINGISTSICTSLKYLNELVIYDKKRDPGHYTWFEINVQLNKSVICFSPDFAESTTTEKSIRTIITTVIKDLLDISIQIQRIDTGGVGDYLVEMKDNYQIRFMLNNINNNLDMTEKELNAYRDQFSEFKKYTSEDPHQYFENFLKSEKDSKKKEADTEGEIAVEETEEKNPLLKGMRTKIPSFDLFDEKINELKTVKEKVKMIKNSIEFAWIKVNAEPLKKALEHRIDEWINVFLNFLTTQIQMFIKNCKDFEEYLIKGVESGMKHHSEEREQLMNVMEVIAKHRLVNNERDATFEFMRKMISQNKKHSGKSSKEESIGKEQKDKEDYLSILEEINSQFSEIFQQVISVKTDILEQQQKETESLKLRIDKFSKKVVDFRKEYLEHAPLTFTAQMNTTHVDAAYELIDSFYFRLDHLKQEAIQFNKLENLFELEPTKYKALTECSVDIGRLKTIWDMIGRVQYTYESWRRLPWKSITIEKMTTQNEQFLTQLIKGMQREIKGYKIYQSINEIVNNMKKTLTSIDRLTSKAMLDRHWQLISNEVGATINHKDMAFGFDDIYKVEIHKYEKFVEETYDNATKELKIGSDLDKINNNWAKLSFEFENFNQAGGELKIFKNFDTIQEFLDNDTNKVLSLLSQGKSVEVFKDQLNGLRAKLNQVDNILNVWGKVQKNWKRLVNIFLLSEDIRNQLQDATKLFDQKNLMFRDIMVEVAQNPIITQACTDARKVELDEILKAIEDCEKKLNIYLEQKKKAFPRFYFVSNQTLIDILSNGNNPALIATDYLGDLFDGVKKLQLEKSSMGPVSANAMVSKDGEIVPFRTPFEPQNEVEIWLSSLELKMREVLQEVLEEAKGTADEYFNSPEIKDENKMDWITKFCAQIALVAVQITWTDDVHKSFEDMEGGMASAMKDCFEGVKRRINLLISKVRDSTISRELRDKIITIITIDVHSRDVVEKLLLMNITDKDSFQWYSQLKFYWTHECTEVLAKQSARFSWEKNKEKSKAIIKIIDWMKFYSYEYVGNCGRLVITPLTDRCYITLTQALSLYMGGAPAGPAGTGKTETTKDLGRACGLPVFVFNCSEQMNIHSLGQIFMGLSQTGSWGCFDEFNRISIEVLSVVSTQVKQVLDALKERKERFTFMEEEISLFDTVGFFITMNPGYAGRTELPENLKALFRSCAMVVPDLILICENMLMSEGYQQARELAKKFVTLYSLNKSLLSNQKHYDWGLRAVKSVLRQAGKLKRANEGKSEDMLLFGALRDFNMSKIVTDDKPIFQNLLSDLFSELEKIPEPIVDEDLKHMVANKAKEMSFIPEEQFCLKCVQLSEILEVRHCVFIIGPPGCGKSSVWKTLAAANKNRGMDTEYDCLDPKAVTADELFGILTKTKEFKNGVLSSIIKNQCKENGKYKPSHKMKWAILDGDIDPGWIESLNTVMDDNKMLTLVSNDRFALTPSMRLLFEISNMRHATPATVSRAGVLYINDSDIGWKPYFESWLEKHRETDLNESNSKKQIYAFDQAAISVFLKCQSYIENPEIGKLTHIVPTVEIMLIETTLTIIDGILEKHEGLLKDIKKEDDLKLVYEGIFLYAAMWGFGGTILESNDDQNFKDFNRIWKSQAKIKYPEISIGDGQFSSVFDFFFDIKTMAWASYENSTTEFADDIPFNKIFIPTIHTNRLWELTSLHIEQQKPIMFIGSAGTGKTALLKQFINTLKEDKYQKTVINFSSKTTSESLQQNIMSSGLSKLGMRLWGLGSGRTLVFFIDDVNMPYVDIYGTQSPIALMRQIVDYGILYDRDNLEEYNKIQDLYFCTCLNPKSGSFTIEPRLQRHFSGFCLPTPNQVIIKQIYKTILKQHFNNFDSSFANMADKIVDATQVLYKGITEDKNFLPSAKKFHYQFNLRELSKVTEGVMQSFAPLCKGAPIKIMKLWSHECRRVFQDRLISTEDQKKFDEFLTKALNVLCDNHVPLSDAEKADVLSTNNIFTSFVSLIEGDNEKSYLAIDSIEKLKITLQNKLAEYNETKAQMNLVLFNNAILHITRISRILDRTNGHGLLVGVGGSGKQSLTKIAAFLQGYELDPVPNISIYNSSEFKTFLGDIIKKAIKSPGTNKIIMATDGQIRNEEMMVFFNDLLNNGFIPNLWAREEQEALVNSLKKEADQSGNGGGPDKIFEYFVEKIRKNVHLILCMSPVGDSLRIRSRKFPGIVNSMMIDWFFNWPKEALVEVANSFLADVEFPIEGMTECIAENMAEAHANIESVNTKFLAQERRYNYTTPKSYLELIEFYKTKLGIKRAEIDNQINSLENGLYTISETQLKINDLEKELKVVMQEVEEKKLETTKLIEKVNFEKAIADEEGEKAKEEEIKTNELAAAANEIKEKAEQAYNNARPNLENAQEALGRLSESKIAVMKNLKAPPALVILTGKVMAYIFKGEKVDIFSDKDNEAGWKRAVNIMNNVKRFLQDLKAFSNETAKTLDPNIKENVKKLIQSGKFEVSAVMEVSTDAGNIADWAHNIIKFNESYNIVKPLEEEKNKAEETVRIKNKELEVVKERVHQLNLKVAELERQLREAEFEQSKVEAERAMYLRKLEAADKLVSGLASENKRWTLNVQSLNQQKFTVIGDTLLAAEFVSYIGPFTANFRYLLWHDTWIEEISKRKIPISDSISPLKILTTNAEMAKWKNESLPEDEMSLQNATIVNSCSRWPLLIDPQLQGTIWLKKHFTEIADSSKKDEKTIKVSDEDEENRDQSNDFVCFSTNTKNWQNMLRSAISYGKKVLFESVSEEFDPILEPLLSRSIIKKGSASFINLGGDQVEYSSKFKIIFQCKLANPHFRPEISAQCTIINFIVTEQGLEDQLLGMVVNYEKQELETKRAELVHKQNEFEVKLSSLEEKLLECLASADPETILDNTDLIENLDSMKKMATSIELQKEEAKVTEKKINLEREKYRVVASEGSMLYFLIISLVVVDHMYQYSLESFIQFFMKSIEKTTTMDDGRVEDLVLNIRYVIYQWISRGLFERHKIIFLTMMTFRLMQKKVIKTDWSEPLMNFLINAVPKVDGPNNLAEWLPSSAWYSVVALGEFEEFRKLPESIEKELPARFRDWFNDLSPENSRLPSDWRKLDSQPFLKLCVIRALRPDRMSNALTNFIKAVLPKGHDFISMDQNFSFNEILDSIINDSTRENSMNTPIFFILSPGADPVQEVEKIGKRKKFEYNLNNFYNIALGQGQDKIAEAKLDAGFKEGYWVMLQNIHLMPSWLPSLEKKLEAYSKEDGVNSNFRIFFSAEPSNSIPVGILERCIKITSEPPTGIKANMKRAWTYFPKEEIDDKDSRYNHILFALCFFHSVLLERRKFGPKGWNMFYPFNIGDLRDSYLVLCKNAESNISGKIPWADLKYIFGEIMYGGHIVNDWDRKLCNSYLELLLEPGLHGEEFELVPFSDGKRPSLKVPPNNSKHQKYLEQIENSLTEETPIVYGLHPNAEIGLGITQCKYIFNSLMELLPKDKSGKSDESQAVKTQFDVYNTRIGDANLKDRIFAISDIKERIVEKGPFQNVFLQECEYMNALLEEVTRSMNELSLGLQGQLTITEQMENLFDSLNYERVPETWNKLAYPSKRGLSSWIDNLIRRTDQLATWKDDPMNIPKITRLNMLFNPMSFLTAIMQYSKKGDLNKLMLSTEFTKKSIEDTDIQTPKDGVYVYGFVLEGARWDWTAGHIEESRPKEMFSVMPVCLCRAVPIPQNGREDRSVYNCPVYRTEDRGNTYIFTANLRTSPKNPPRKWILGGVAILLDVEGISDEAKKDTKT